MSITARGKRWEILHSLWIGWTFTLGFFSWIAFLYVGLRTKQRKWIFWALFYSIPFVVLILAGPPPDQSAWLRASLNVLGPGLWIVSVIHALKIRKEYLLRLSILQTKVTEKETELRWRLHTEMNGGKSAPEPDLVASDKQETLVRNTATLEEGRSTTPTGTTTPSEAAASVPNREQEQSTEPPARTVPPSTSTAFQDRGDNKPEHVSPAPTEVKLAALPKIESGDGLKYRISGSYPFPLAFGFRSLSSIVDVRDLYREQLRIAENMLAFLASVSLALLKEEDREKSDIDPKNYWMTGVSPGDWKDVIARCSKVFANYDDNPMALAIKGLNIRSEKKGFGADVAALVRAKNDFKHDRGPVVLEDIAEASGEVQERLKRCMEALAFFTAHPIRQVEDFDVSRRGESVVLKCLRYTGDHPSFPQEEVVFDRALPRGDLFLDLGQQGWAPLFPFITTMTCSHCKARETYFVDAWDTRKRIARMKSFERGHTMLNQEVSNALAEWVNESAQPGAS